MVILYKNRGGGVVTIPTPTAYGAKVNISSRTAENPYTVPENGLVRIEISYGANAYNRLYVNGDRMAMCSNGPNGTVGYTVVSTPVFKGQIVYSQYSNVTNGGEVTYFIPFVCNEED